MGLIWNIKKITAIVLDFHYYLTLWFPFKMWCSHFKNLSLDFLVASLLEGTLNWNFFAEWTYFRNFDAFHGAHPGDHIPLEE